MSHTPSHQPRRTQTSGADFRVGYHGNVTTIEPLTEAASEWLKVNVEIEAWQRFGPSMALEQGYVEQVSRNDDEARLVMANDDLLEED